MGQAEFPSSNRHCLFVCLSCGNIFLPCVTLFTNPVFFNADAAIHLILPISTLFFTSIYLNFNLHVRFFRALSLSLPTLSKAGRNWVEHTLAFFLS
jgi:hypothetical protein